MLATENPGAVLRKYRRRRGYTLKDLARSTGLSVSYLSEVERGLKTPSLESLQRMCEALNISEALVLKPAPPAEPRPARSDGEGEMPMTLGQKLRLQREREGLSIKEVAEACGISPSYLSDVERDAVQPSVEVLKRLASFLSLPLSVLLHDNRWDLADKVRDLRETLGWSQGQLAEEAGISPAMVAGIEQARVRPSLRTVEALARALGVSPCYLILDQPDVEDLLRGMSPDLRRLLTQPEVQAVLRAICDLKDSELRFVLQFVQLFRRANLTAGE